MCWGGFNWETAVVYLDDVLVYSSSMSEHLEVLKQLLDRFRQAGLKLHPNKCQVAVTKVIFQGHQLDEMGIRPTVDKIKAVKDWPRRSSAKEVRQFLGLVGYYRQYIPHFADKSVHLTNLLQKETNFEWTEDCAIGFQTLKKDLQWYPWIEQLRQYDYIVEHVAGRLIPHVDALSRRFETDTRKHQLRPTAAEFVPEEGLRGRNFENALIKGVCQLLGGKKDPVPESGEQLEGEADDAELSQTEQLERETDDAELSQTEQLEPVAVTGGDVTVDETTSAPSDALEKADGRRKPMDDLGRVERDQQAATPRSLAQ
ncbi:uncharacterized protein LOC119100308 [Pollicipes pollicipes]|uniref:uncharacterized protein LOC119100308 n=1 Tax=Pollicipes pollicipes TaxID=41117 RepID=UPI0018851184|nr:uncharacterized protein LOC119100308 [Pollicipes pollicipes]